MRHHRITAADAKRPEFDVEAAIGEARRAVDLAIIPAFLIRILEPETPGELTADRAYFDHFNEALLHASGFPAGKRLDELLPPRGAAAILANYHAALRSSDPIDYDEEVPTPSGAAAWRTAIKALRAPCGMAYAIIGYAHDMTAVREREMQDAAQIALLKRTVSEIKVYSSMAAHDVRSPLATIESLIELILEDFEDRGDGKAELLSHLSQVTTTARSHMDELLMQSTAFTDTPPAEARVDVGHLCRDLSAIVDPEGRLEIVFPEGDILSDRVALNLLLRNLLTNAGRHAAGRIVVGHEVLDDATGMMRFTVSDDGPGFPAGFDPFAGDEQTRASSGHGFGLAAVRYVVETRGGTVGIAAPALGTGATVAFTLPARPAPEVDAATRAA